MADDKGFKPSAKKIKDARKKGQVLKSPLCTQTAAIAGALSGLFVVLAFRSEEMLGLTMWTIREGFFSIQLAVTAWLSQLTLLIFVPIIIGAVSAMLAEFSQVGLEVHAEIIAPDFARLSPGKGLQKIGQGLMSCWLSTVKILLVSGVAYYVLQKQRWILTTGLMLIPGTSLPILQHAITSTIFDGVLLLGVLASTEYLYKRRKYHRELSMSLDDVRREHKEDEGDPHVKGHRKHLHQSLISQELTKRVRQSKVLIVEKRRNERRKA